MEDITTKIVATRDLREEEKKAQRKALVDGPIPFYLTRLQKRLEAHGGRYFAADRLSVADLKVSEFIRNLRSGALDHVPCGLSKPRRWAGLGHLYRRGWGFVDDRVHRHLHRPIGRCRARVG